MGCKSVCKQTIDTGLNKPSLARKVSTTTSDKLRWVNIPLGLLLAILPKCHFCLLTYSSAITLCSGKTFHTSKTGALTWLPLLVVVILLLSILLNYKGKKTWLSLSITASAAILLLWSQFVSGQMWLYYLASAILLFGTWVNGSFSFFLRHKFSLFTLESSNLKLKMQPFKSMSTNVWQFFLYHKNKFT